MDSVTYISKRIWGKRVLSKEEVKDLIYKYRAGNENAGSIIIEHNIRYVLKISGYYAKIYRIDIDDIVSYGILGLYKALERFKPEKGFTFSTYANQWIRQAIVRFILFKKDIVSSKDYKNYKKFTFNSIDDDEYWRDKNNCTVVENKNKKLFLKKKIAEYLDKLDDRTKQIMIMKFGFDPNLGEMTLRDIGKKVNLSGEMVRQIVRKQLKSMRRTKKIRALKDR